MDTCKSQQGQSVIEFALVLPIFLFMFIGFAYTALLCHDYLTLTTIARDSARAATVGVDEATIRSRYSTQTFLTDVYTWDASKPADFTITSATEDANNASAGNRVTITLTAHCNVSSPIKGFSLPPTIQSSLTMHKE
ncbi:MAG: TadE family protein [Firmicutes bacterium]|nr:TadE family protein [Bacillota bacterium]